MKLTNNLLAKAFPSVEARNQQIQRQALKILALIVMATVLAAFGLICGLMEDGHGYIRVVITDDGEEIYARDFPIDAAISPIVDRDLFNISYRASSTPSAAGLLITGEVQHVSVGTEIKITPIPNLDGEISSAQVSVSHSNLKQMQRVPQSQWAGDYYEHPIISTTKTNQLVWLRPGRETIMGMSTPSNDAGEFKIALSLIN